MVGTQSRSGHTSPDRSRAFSPLTRLASGASGSGVVINAQTPPREALLAMPGWALRDLTAALQAVVSLQFLTVLALSALLFYVLMLWRQRGASAQG